MTKTFIFGGRTSNIGQRIIKKILHPSQRRGIDYDPYDRDIRARLAEQMFSRTRDHLQFGTIECGRQILDLIEESFPSHVLTAAYFKNLDLLLDGKKPRQNSGQIVLGLGSGRSGSTSLVAILSKVDGHCCTHENPPLISWKPEVEEIQFHIKRFQLLSHYFALVADVSHWWINALDELLVHFPNAKAVGLIRDTAHCANSFMKIKGFGVGSYNHWAPYGNGIWATAQWDPTYPTYAVPEKSERDPDRAKMEMITRYVREYNERLQHLATRMPDTLMLVKTEDLDAERVQAAIFKFIGMHGRFITTKLNVGTTADGRNLDFKF